jgi:hypothetical protein
VRGEGSKQFVRASNSLSFISSNGQLHCGELLSEDAKGVDRIRDSEVGVRVADREADVIHEDTK